MGGVSQPTVAAIPPPPPAPDIFDSFAKTQSDKESFRQLAATGMRSAFLTGTRGIEGGGTVPGSGTTLPSISEPGSLQPSTGVPKRQPPDEPRPGPNPRGGPRILPF